MKKTDNTNLITVCKLLKELTEYEDKFFDNVVACWISEDTACGIFGVEVDNEGDLCIHVEEMPEEGNLDSEYWDICTLLEVLKGYDKDTRIYLAGCGQLLEFELNRDSTVLSIDEEEDSVNCFARAYGEYEDEPSKDVPAKPGKTGNREDRILSIVLMTISVASAGWFGYNTYALAAHTAGRVWESILWMVVCAVLLVVCGWTLYYSKDKK